ncbi:MAG TPA: sulfite exporter TauE/SafE family protein, partial [Planctomycetota bacterium]|nr:sulfite exporter TauE/SafE family protein [Planctomycetota bacterium]
MTAISEGFLFGLGSSVHCAAMCGPIALAMGADARAALAYHAARAGGYCTAGAVLGALGSSARLASLESTAPWIGFVLAAGLVLGALGGERLLGAVPGSARVVRACFARARRWPARLRLAALGA